jgi:hypothetical protein
LAQQIHGRADGMLLTLNTLYIMSFDQEKNQEYKTLLENTYR